MGVVTGTNGDETLGGTTGDDSLLGLGGNDTLFGLGGGDTFDGGTGTDIAVEDESAVAGSFSGGLGAGALYHNNVGSAYVGFNSIEALNFTGNATGTTGGTGVSGSTGDDTLTGLSGNDTFSGGRGNNIIDGGTGTDFASFDFSDRNQDLIFVNGGVPGTTYTATVGGVPAGSVTNVEAISIIGGSGNDRIGSAFIEASTSLVSAFVGNGGNDTVVIDASALSGALSGGIAAGGLFYNNSGSAFVNISSIEALSFTGNATGTTGGTGVSGSTGNDTLTGLSGNDTFSGGRGNDVIDGGAGNDFAVFDFSDRTQDLVFVNGASPGVAYTATVGGAFAGSVTNVETISITGGSGNDHIGAVLTLTSPVSTFVGNGGQDVLEIDASALPGSISGGIPSGGLFYNNSGSAFVNISSIEALHFTGNATGTTGATGVGGSTGNDTLTGLAGNDTFSGGHGNDVIDGGAGNDFAIFDFSDRTQDLVFVNGAVAGVTYTATVGGVSAGSVTNVETISITGGSGNDHIGAVLTGTSPVSTFIGNGGQDVLEIDASALAGAISGGLPAGGLFYNNNGSAFVNISSIEALHFTGNATGTTGATGIGGSTGNDTLTGLSGNDTFSGGHGNDVIDGGLGNDFAAFDFSDRTQDLIFVNGAAAGVTYGALVGGVAAGSVANVETISITGGSGNDRIGGVLALTSPVSTLIGNGGTDVAVLDASALTGSISGGISSGGLFYNNSGSTFLNLSSIEALEFTGNATGTTGGSGITGGSGNDTLTGLSGNDSFSGGAGNDLIIGAAGTDSLQGGDGDDRIQGDAGNDTLSGDNNNDTLIDNLGANQLSGGGGNDMFIGVAAGTGADSLSGGTGIDTYVLNADLSQPITLDQVSDFTPGAGGDIINLFQMAGQLSGFTAGSDPIATGYARFLQSGADVLFQIDPDGSSNGGQFTTVLKLQNVSAASFTSANISFVDPSITPLAPRAGLDTGFTTTEDATVGIGVSTLLANDHSLSASGQAGLTFLGLASATSSGGATLTLNGATITYDPGPAFQYLRAGQTLTDSFSYQIADDVGTQATGNVYVTVTGVNDPPVAVNDPLFTALAVQTPNLWTQLLNNDTDPDHGDTLTIVSIDSSASRGTVTFDAANHSIVYQASGPQFDPFAPGTDSFTYTIQDSSGAQSTATANILLTAEPLSFSVTSASAPAQLTDLSAIPVDYHIDHGGLATHGGIVTVEVFLSQDGVLDATDHQVGTQTFTLSEIGTADGTFDGEFVLPPAVLGGEPFGTYHFLTRATLTLDDSAVTPVSTAASGSALFSPSYSAHVDVAGNIFVGGDSVPMTGTAISTADGTPVSFADVTVTVTHNGVSQDFSATTDAFGNFTVDYPSFDGMAGLFQVDAHHPNFAAEDAAPEDSFSLVDLNLAESAVSLAVASGTASQGTLTLSNPSDQALTNLGADIAGLPNGWDFTINDLPATLAAHSSTTLHYTLTTPAGVDSESFDVNIHSSEGAADSSHFDVAASPVAANLVLDDSALTRGVMVGDQKFVELTIHNTGQQAATGVSVELPGLSWMSLAGNANLADIPGGGAATIGLFLNPPDDVPLGHYLGQIFVDYDGSQPSVANFDFNATTDAIGGLHIDLTDEGTFFTPGSPLVQDATVRLYDTATGALVQRFTNVDGALDVDSLTAGTYRVEIAAPDHISYNRTVAIDAGDVRSLQAFLPGEGVTYSWSVEETTLEDRYHIELDSTFKTDVPVPVVTMDPPILKYADLLPGQSKVIDLTITNQGLIQVDNIGLDLPDPIGFTITPLIDHIDVLDAKQSKVVPVTIHRLPNNQPPPPDPPPPGGPPSPDYDPTFCADSGHSSGTLSYHYECGPDGVWRLVPEGYDGPDSSSAPCLPGQGGAIVTGPGSPGGTGVTSSGGGFGGSGSGSGSGSGNGTGGHNGPQFGYVPNPQETDQNVRCDTGGSPGDDTPNPNCLIPLGIKIFGGLLVGALAPEGLLLGAAVSVAGNIAVDAAAAYFGAGGGGAGKAAVLKGAVGSFFKQGGEALQDNGLNHLDNLGGLGPAMAGTLRTIKKGLDAGENLTDLFKCLSQLNSSGGGSLALDGKDHSHDLSALLTTNTTGGFIPEPTDLPSLEAALVPLLGPRFDGLAQVDDLVTRMLAYSDFREYLVGDLRWFDTHDGNGLVNFLGYVSQAYQNLVPIVDPSAIPVPNDVDPSLLDEFVTRYNNTVDNWNNGIFRVQDVPAGGSTDFVDVNTLLNLYQRVAGPANAPQSVHDAIGAYDQQLLANVAEAQNELQVAQQEQVEGTCATIHLRIEQDVVMSRQAFVGSFAMETNDDDLSNINLNIVITDDNGNVILNNVFGVTNDFLDGIGALNGTDGLLAHSALSSEYTFLPSTLAAPDGPTQYHIGGTLSYHDVTDDHDHVVDLDPVTINVLPQAELTLDYFQQRDVVADDPFTDDIVEPSQPFVLGVLVSNDGKGVAHDLRIESAQPEIIDNKKGLLIDFNIVGSKVDGDSPSGSLTAVFGDIDPGQTASGAWFLESSLQGKFLDYKATFSHTDALGLPELSLIKTVNIHELIHGGDFDGDSRIDFLANDDPDLQDAPDHVYFADGAKFDVAQGTGAAQIQSQDASHIVVTLTTSAGSGWENFDVASPVDQTFRITSVVRSDSTALFSGQYWFTDRTFNNVNLSPVYENRIHILDDHPGTTYTITFDSVGTGTEASTGDDTLQGTIGDDSLDGLAGNDQVHGDLGNDSLSGSADNDTLFGDDGADTLDGGPGADSMSGGNGNDTYIVDSAGDSVTEAAGAGSGIDTIKTTLNSYSLAPAAFANVEDLVFTGAGNFSGTGNGAANTISGGSGNDTLDGGAGADSMIGSSGNDTYVIDDAGDQVSDSAGIDTIQTTLNSYSLAALGAIENLAFIGAGDFAGTGNNAANTLTGGSGNDTLDGGAGADSMAGNGGNDTYVIDAVGDQVSDSAGTDTIETSLNTYSLATLVNIEALAFTGTGDFSGTGNSGANTLTGGSGNDTLDGGAGPDSMAGNGGNDTYLLDDAGDQVSDSAGLDTIRTTLNSYTLGTGFENLVFTGAGTFAGTGNLSDNSISGGGSADTLIGDEGSDTLDGGAGNDSLSGGNGDDTYVVDSAGDIVSETGTGTDTVKTGLTAYTLGSNLENLIYTGAAGFKGSGNGADNLIVSGVGNDTLDGGAGNDTLDGGAGADRLTGLTGNDTYRVDNSGDVIVEASGGGTDTALTSVNYTLASNVENLTYMLADYSGLGTGSFVGTGNTQGNIITGGSGSNTLSGLSGNDTLIGGGSNDNINGGTGSDSMAGGAGDDTYVVDNALDAILENPGEGADDLVQTALSAYTLAANVENLIYTGLSSFRGAGNGDGNDISSGSGNDTLDGGAGADTLTGGDGNDTYVVDDVGDSVVETGTGTDTVKVSIGSYSLVGTTIENLTYTGGSDFAGTGNASANTITGGIGNDTIDGGAGIDRMVGGAGNDVYYVDNSADVIVESSGGGNDTVHSLVSYTLSGNVDTLIFDGVGNFAGTGSNQANTIIAGAGNDTLDGGSNADTMIGGDGNDTYFVDSGSDLVTETSNALGGIDVVNTTATKYTLTANVENLNYIGASSFRGAGNSDGNVIASGIGNDTLDGAGGVDTMIGGAGNDTYIVDDLGETVTENPGGGIDTVKTALGGYTLGSDVDVLTYIGGANFAGQGNGLDNTITGGIGNDALDGGIGNDSLNGGTGNDVLIGGMGADTMVGGSGADTYFADSTDVITESGSDIDVVHSSGNFTLGASLETLIYDGVSNFAGTGNTGHNSILGGNGADTLSGLAGNDTLDGGAGADNMAGGIGNDLYVVDNAGDAVTENAGEGTDTIQTSLASYTLTIGDNFENLTFTGGAATGTGNELNNTINGGGSGDSLDGNTGNDTVHGNNGGDTVAGGDGADKLYGDAGNDSLDGGLLNDSLDGGAGLDLMRGGTGADRFVFTASDGVSGGATIGEIVDFSHAQGDKIDLSAIDATGVPGTAFTFPGGAPGGAFTGTPGQLHFVVNGSGGVNVAGDIDGDGVADFIIVVDGVASLTAADFVL